MGAAERHEGTSVGLWPLYGTYRITSEGSLWMAVSLLKAGTGVTCPDLTRACLTLGRPQLARCSFLNDAHCYLISLRQPRSLDTNKQVAHVKFANTHISDTRACKSARSIIRLYTPTGTDDWRVISCPFHLRLNLIMSFPWHATANTNSQPRSHTALRTAGHRTAHIF